MFAIVAALALRFPGTARILDGIWGFLKRYWKIVLAVVLVVAAYLYFVNWRDNLIEASDAAGYARAESQYTALVDAANEKERLTQGRLDQMSIAFNGIAAQREQAINLTLYPQIESITNEVANDPRYRECLVSSGVFDSLNAGRSTVDQSITASNPRGDR